MVCLIFIKKLLYWGEEIIVYNVNSLSAFDLIKGLAAHVSRLIMHGFPAPAVQPQNFPLAAAHHLTDRHARSRRRRPGGYVPRRRPGRPSTSDRRRRGRIDPMGRMWPVGKDHATPRHDRWFDFPPPRGPRLPVPPGPHYRTGREVLAALRLFGSQWIDGSRIGAFLASDSSLSGGLLLLGRVILWPLLRRPLGRVAVRLLPLVGS